MHHRIVSVLRRLRNAPAQQLDRPEILDACRQVKHTWRHLPARPRRHHPPVPPPDPPRQYRHQSSRPDQRPRLHRLGLLPGPEPLALGRVPGVAPPRRPAAPARDRRDRGRWHGHRVFVADGSSFSMPDVPELQEHFGQPSVQQPGCGFPVAHLLALFHVGTGMLLEVLTAPLCTHDMSGVARLHPQLRRRRRAAGRPRLLLVRAPGAAGGPRGARRLPHPSASDRRLHAAIGPMPDRARRQARKGSRIRGGCGVWA